MDLQKLSNDQILTLLQELEETETTHTIKDDALLRQYMDSLNPRLAIIQAPIDIWKEAARRWKETLNKVTWIGNTGVGVLRKN